MLIVPENEWDRIAVHGDWCSKKSVEQNMTLAGVWKNEYGSIMTLNLAEPNMLTGTYESSTGSFGTYRVIGYETNAEPTPNSPYLSRLIGIHSP
jgi:hypothetical protein